MGSGISKIDIMVNAMRGDLLDEIKIKLEDELVKDALEPIEKHFREKIKELLKDLTIKHVEDFYLVDKMSREIRVTVKIEDDD